MSNLQDVPLRIDACHVCGNPAAVYHVGENRVLGIYCEAHGVESKERFDRGQAPIAIPDEGFVWREV